MEHLKYANSNEKLLSKYESAHLVRSSRLSSVGGGAHACKGTRAQRLWPPPRSTARSRVSEAAFRSPPPAGEMSPNSIPKYLKRPLWRERKWPGRGERGRATVGQRRARQSHGAPRPRRAASRIPARLPPNLFSRDPRLRRRRTVRYTTHSGPAAARPPDTPPRTRHVNFANRCNR